jgi:hypothetical protein
VSRRSRDTEFCYACNRFNALGSSPWSSLHDPAKVGEQDIERHI